MAAETPVDVGFAEFVARLISELFSSVVTAQMDQEERHAELMQELTMPPEEVATRQISADMIEAELIRLFPPREVDRPGAAHAIYPGAPCLIGQGGLESPAIEATLGLTIQDDWLEEGQEGMVLTKAAVEAVVTEVALSLARSRLAILEGLAKRGVPRIVVDSGRINAKLTFQLVSTSSEESDEESDDGTPSPATSAASSAAAERPLRFTNIDRTLLFGGFTPSAISAITRPKILPDVKVMVKPADDRSPQTSQVKANVYGEVEITFKTVT